LHPDTRFKQSAWLEIQSAIHHAIHAAFISSSQQLVSGSGQTLK
jgi:hypothetical protein